MKYQIIGLTRLRNESLIIADTLRYVSKLVDAIIVYDDCSKDDTIRIVKQFPKVIRIIKNKKWKKNRLEEETRHRQILLKAGKKYNPEWFYYFDADERLEGNIKKFINSNESNNINGIRVRLYDAYMTPSDKKPYKEGFLYNFRKYFGPEMREILMIFRNKPNITYQALDAREPVIKGRIIAKFYCQHYGKSLSVAQWEEACRYYARYFPRYREKWLARKGKAVHRKSDFGRSLYQWDMVKKRPVRIYRYGRKKLFIPKFIKILRKNKLT